jgi:hypothetical protein
MFMYRLLNMAEGKAKGFQCARSQLTRIFMFFAGDICTVEVISIRD